MMMNFIVHFVQVLHLMMADDICEKSMHLTLIAQRHAQLHLNMLCQYALDSEPSARVVDVTRQSCRIMYVIRWLNSRLLTGQINHIHSEG